MTPLVIKNESQARDVMSSLGVDSEGIKILSSKGIYAAFKIEGISSWEANIIKQHLLSLGTDAAINRDALVKRIKTDILIFGNARQLRQLCDKLRNQPFKLKEISRELSSCLDGFFRKEYVFRARDKVLRITEPVICGIVNVTPDSFSGDGLLKQAQNTKCPSDMLGTGKMQKLVLKKVAEMAREGAKIIDVGGESSRPFSKPVKETEEIKRVIPVLRLIRKEFKKLIISVDTYKYAVAKAAVDEGVDVINDITALRKALKMVSLVKRYRLGCILMHMSGRPATMQINPKYKDVTADIISFLKERLEFVTGAGIGKDRILLDPGIGFGKRLEDNLRIINELYKFKILGLPIFLGASRKSFIGKVLDVEVGERAVGTLAAHIISVVRGANVLRVHDVAQTKQALKIACQIMGN
ncbi:MAG: dihydropteroate synthase [Candidatus Omnitrophota bacterium]|nr:MAG: dihydropteroate synthase [Candidatus Omnitrophota bacterium]